MCGINGVIEYNNHNFDKADAVIHMMNERICHRGPDDEGVFSDGGVNLGMRRLSIIDLSRGSQPIYNEDRSKVIVFNGEIYNYKQLREQLVLKGHIFSTETDTEVVLHLYEQYGLNCFELLDGMFAFAIYDKTLNKVIAVRDRTGEKPFYYYKNSDCFIFASELKSIIGTGKLPKKICTKALYQYLQLTYIPAPLTIFENVYKLLPGHYMVLDLSGEAEIKSYWNVEYNCELLINDYESCKKQLREAVFKSVHNRMVSDVPLGAFLSGGIDSSTVVGVMSSISDSPVDTFTIGFSDKKYDESDRASLVSKKYNTNHHIHFLEFDDALCELERIFENMDEPFADSSAIPTYMVSKYAKQYVSVVLTGDSGDELFGGYSKYLIGYYSQLYNKIPEVLRKNVIEKAVYSMPDTTILTRKIRKVISNAENDVFTQRKNLMCLGFKQNELELLLKERAQLDNSLDIIGEYYNTYIERADEISCALYTDFKVVLEGDMFPKVDRMSMLNSLETRIPFLSKEIIELAAKIPSQFKIDRTNQKIILKDAFSDIIPKELQNAPKRGFSVPIAEWLKNELKSDLLKTLSKEKIIEQGLFSYDYIKELLDEHFSNKADRSSVIWSLYVFEKWYDRYFV